jgi:ATP-dependent RNA helicase DDX21
LKALILDETDQMLNIGFQEDIEFIIKSIEKEFEEIKRKRSKLQMILFSATVPRWVDKVARKFMKEDLVYVDLVKDGYNKTSMTVEHFAMQVPSAHHKLKSISDLVMVYGGAHCRTIIFTDTKGKLGSL